MSKILIAEADRSVRELLLELFQEHGEQVVGAANGPEALQQVEQQGFDLIISALRLPGDEGVDILHTTSHARVLTPVLILAAPTEIAAAVEALELGAVDYVLKRVPMNLDEIRIRAGNVVEHYRLAQTAMHVRQIQPYICDCDQILNHSTQLRRILARLRTEASPNTAILIRGEPGSGKVLLAAAIHATGQRSRRPFVHVNCAGLPEAPLERELFGDVSDTSPPELREGTGCLERANLGTLLLDLIGSMSLGTQAKILRLLRRGEFEQLGSSRTIAVDVRVVATTCRGLQQAVREGRFLSDLYARVSEVSIDIPPLRETPEDILPLANFFIQKYDRHFGRSVERFDADAQEALLSYGWPGNIRELENTVERCVLLAQGAVVGASSLGLEERSAGLPGGEERVVRIPPRGIALEEIERQALMQALERTGWVQKAAAAMLDISPRVMHYKLKTHGITHPKWGRRR
jgi:DNA-binding NtrC family response regulator